MNSAKKEKIVVIGGGIAGLTAGIYGLLSGFEVEIYEKNAIPGGECIGWNRKGYHIDNCIHVGEGYLTITVHVAIKSRLRLTSKRTRQHQQDQCSKICQDLHNQFELIVY